jgi:hypothetical protein
MYPIRHYWVRLRWGRRLPYSVARKLILSLAAILFTLVVLVLLGVVGRHSLEQLMGVTRSLFV